MIKCSLVRRWKLADSDPFPAMRTLSIVTGSEMPRFDSTGNKLAFKVVNKLSQPT